MFLIYMYDTQVYLYLYLYFVFCICMIHTGARRRDVVQSQPDRGGWGATKTGQNTKEAWESEWILRWKCVRDEYWGDWRDIDDTSKVGRRLVELVDDATSSSFTRFNKPVFFFFILNLKVFPTLQLSHTFHNMFFVYCTVISENMPTPHFYRKYAHPFSEGSFLKILW